MHESAWWKEHHTGGLRSLVALLTIPDVIDASIQEFSIDESARLWLQKYLQGGMQFDADDRNVFIELLNIAKDIHVNYPTKGSTPRSSED